MRRLAQEVVARGLLIAGRRPDTGGISRGSSSSADAGVQPVRLPETGPTLRLEMDGLKASPQPRDAPVAPSLDRFLRRGAPAAVAGVILSLGLPYARGVSGESSLMLGAILTGIALLLALTEPRETRGTFLSLFAWGYLIRLAVLMALDVVVRAPVSMLGPDSSTYLRMSQILADSVFRLPLHPAFFLGTYDAGPYYLFASVLYGLNGDLFSLRLLNCGLTALVGPLVFSWFRLTLPRFAALAGFVVAVHPSVIAFSTVDLLKDPAVLFFTALAVWALSRILAGTRVSAQLGFALIAAVALVFLRMARFYVVFYLEVAIVAVIIGAWLWRPWQRRLTRVAVLIVLGVLLVAELGPMQLGWPSSLKMTFDVTVFGVLNRGGFGSYAPGLVSRLPERRGTALRGPFPFRPRLDPSASLSTRIAFKVVVQGANLIRRLYGPFVWVPPERWDISTILGGDYLLYPGTLIWYWLMPFVGLGVVATGARLYRGQEGDPIVAAMWLFFVVYFAQYLTINLSYRQRDVMLPFLLAFAFIGMQRARSSPRWRWAYAAYWACILLLATGHLFVRARI
jgi:hypothetical protein